VNTKHTQKKPRLREKTDRAWFSCLLRHTPRAGLFFQPRAYRRPGAQGTRMSDAFDIGRRGQDSGRWTRRIAVFGNIFLIFA